MYSYKKEISFDFLKAIQRVKEELKSEGFGVLTEIDVKATLKNKLDVDFEEYVILGACNPPFAYKALLTEKEIGLMLPCNVIVYQDKKKIFVSAILPTQAMKSVNNSNLNDIANSVEQKLKRVIDNI